MPSKTAEPHTLDRPGPSSDERREHIRKVAEGLFAERGFAATSMRTVARAADVQVGTIYYHCGSKAQLFLSLYSRVIKRMAGIVRSSSAATGDLDPTVGALIDRTVAFFVENPTVPRILQRIELGELEGIAESQRLLQQPLFALVAAELSRRADNGEIRAVDPESFIVAAGAVVLGLSIDATRSLPVDPARLAAAQTHARAFILGARGLDPASKPRQETT